MKSSIKVAPLTRVKADLFAIAVGSLDGGLPASLRNLDTYLNGSLARAINAGDFSGKRYETSLIYPPKGPKRILLVGLGKLEEMTQDAARRAAAVAGRQASALGARSVAFYVVPEHRGGVPLRAMGQVVVEGVAQGNWSFDEFKATEEPKKPISALQLIATNRESTQMRRGRKIGAAIAAGHKLARDLQALPSNVCTPEYLANTARSIGETHGFKVTVLGEAQIRRAGMGALTAVSQGSAQEPRFIVIEYRGKPRQAPICLVGKGVTFDSGGISIKPALNMEEMKYDMSGAAAVLGTFEVLGRLRPATSVVGLIPATENLPSGTAVKPGDIVTSHLGKTIEIVNTDAEGRLILCDALSYARRFRPACLLDAATLTGAVVIALGSHATGLMGNDDQLREEVRVAGDLAGERCCPLPLWDEYREQIRSEVADVKNVGGKAAGPITAGWFLREFVDRYPWCHLDIAGTAYTDKDTPYRAKGPTGIGVRLFTQFVLGRA